MSQSDSKVDSVFDLDIISSILSLTSSAFIGWAISLLATDNTKMIAGLAAGLMSAIILTLRANCGNTRAAFVIKILSWTLFIATLLISVALAVWCRHTNVFIIVNGSIILIYISIVCFIARSGQ